MIDAFACESHFVDHLAPVWRALPERGRFYTAPPLVDRARWRGVDAEAIDVTTIRNTPQKPPTRSGRPALIASIGDAKIGRRLGYGPFAFLEHGAGQTYGQGAAQSSYSGGPGRDDHELVMVPNEHSAQAWRRNYPRTRVELVGCPKLDSLPSRDGGEPPVVAVSWHWPAPVSVSGFAGSAFGEYRQHVEDLAGRFRVIGHQHPNWLGRNIPGPPSKLYAKLGIPFVPDFEDVCRQADVYVCDNSSTIFEFAATGRPVVLLNSRWWSRKGGPGLRFWDAAHVGINVWPQDDLLAAVDAALADPPERQADREDALRRVYPVRSGGAELAARAITEWLTSRETVAA